MHIVEVHRQSKRAAVARAEIGADPAAHLHALQREIDQHFHSHRFGDVERDDIFEQMRNEAQFLNDRAVDQRDAADAAEPLLASLDARQKATFIEEMVRLSRERGLD